MTPLHTSLNRKCREYCEREPLRVFGEHAVLYTKIVRFLRVVFPAAALGLVALVLLWPQLAPKQEQFRIGFADVEIANENLSMIKPRYVGTDDNNRPFSITATSVRNLTLEGDEMALDMPEAEITLEDSEWVMVSADFGSYRVEEKILYLTGTVRVFHDRGYALQSDEALIDLEKNIVMGNAPVVGQGPAGYIEGQGFYIDESGSTVNVLGPARMMINPTSQDSQ